MTLLIVPMPGRCRSGIHSSMTSAPAMMIHVPMDSPVRRASPWWSVSQGSLPSREDTWRATPSP
jgi:hypothetical protein